METDRGNWVYKFWYIERSDGTSINAIRYRHLVDKLPDVITIAKEGPYLDTAEAVVNQYAAAVKWVPFCEGRSKAWADALQQKLLEAIPADRT